MNRKVNFFVFSLLYFYASLAVADAYRFNSLGFTPDSAKIATIIGECDSFSVCDSTTRQVVFSGTVEKSDLQSDVAQIGRYADFSVIKQPGRYYLEVEGLGRSHEFEIDKSVYSEPLKTAMRAFYLWRCGCAVTGEYSGNTYSHPACHLEDGWLDYTGLGKKLHKSTGGWHDAGDHGKYVVNGSFSLGLLFNAWEHFGDKLAGLELDLPDVEFDCPDFLKELKWESDWLLTMQYPDGSGRVSHKLTALNFSGYVMPEDDYQKRYLTEWSTAATANFAAVMAQASYVFEPYNSDYASKCLAAAEASYKFLAENPAEKPFVQGPFSTGDYNSRDWDDRLWMLAELWRATGQQKYLTEFETQSGRINVSSIADYGWGQLSTLAVVTYLNCQKPGRNQEIFDRLSQQLKQAAQRAVSNSASDIYRRPLASKYYWGCNGSVAGQVLILTVADRLSSDKSFKDTSQYAVSHLFGSNYYGRSFVTGLGINPPMNPHDRRSAADGIVEPWPGYLVGGGHSATDWKDQQDDYRTNEIAINWQAALVYALAALDSRQ